MISVDEMKKILEKEFGITTEAELDLALKKLGGIKIGVFIDDNKNK